MSRLPSGFDHTGGTGRLIRIASLTAITLAMLSATAGAQATKKAAAAPTPLDPRPLSRFVPRDNLTLLVEFQGLDLQADAWTKTAAYKMLNETPLGEMLESMTAQLADRAMANVATKRMSGADLVTVIKHAMKSGFIFGVNSVSDSKQYGTFVVRNGTAKEVRAPFSRVLGQCWGASKPSIVKKAGRSMISIPMAGPAGDTWTWWAEQNDLVVVLGKETEDVVAATIDGTKPNASENPIRAELLKADGGFTPAVVMFIDPKAVTGDAKQGSPTQAFGQVTNLGIKRLDFRWGFQDDALMSVWRLQAPKPRKGMLALFDQPSMDKSKLVPMPEGLTAFTAMSLDSAKVFDAVMENLPAASKSSATASLDSLKTKSRIDLRKELLAHIGPKMAFYTMPGAAAKPGDAPAAGGVLGGLSIPGLGPVGAIPKFTLIAEVDDRAAFEKTLDRLMVALNRELKDRAAEQAKALEGGAGPGAPGGRAGGGGGGLSATGAAGDDSPRPGARGRRPGGGGEDGPPPPEPPQFKLVLGKDKIYQLTVPAGAASPLPPGFRPSIRLGAKYVVIAVAPDAARIALEAKPGDWTVGSDLAPAFDRLSQNLMFLSVNDPRDTMPELLASLPANLQRGVNTALALAGTGQGMPLGGPGAPGGAGGMAGPNAAAPGGPAPGVVSGGPGAGGVMTPGVLRPPGSGGGGAGGYPGASGGYPGAMPGAGGPGGAGGNADQAAAPAMIQFNIDPSKLPKADDLRARMFPSTFSVVVDDQEVRLVSRTAFPNLLSPAGGIGIALVLPAVQAARDAARRAAGLPAGGPPPGLTPPPGTGARPGAGIPADDAPGGRRRGGGGGGGRLGAVPPS